MFLRSLGLVAVIAGALVLPWNVPLPHALASVAGGALILAGAPSVLRRRKQLSDAPRPVTPAPAAPPEALPTRRTHSPEEQVYSIALHDVRRMIEKMPHDARLIIHIARRLTQAVEDGYEERVRTN